MNTYLHYRSGFIFSLLIFTAISAGIITGCGGNKQGEGKADSSPAPEIIDTKAHSDSKGAGRFTNVPLSAFDASEAEKGKAVFTTKCSACHKTTEVKLVGPGLLGVTKRRTPEWIMNMITNPAEMLQSDPVARKLLEEHLTPMTFQNVSDEDARRVLEYLRQNDGAK